MNPASKIGPQRTTRTASKLKLLPNPDVGDDGPDEESGRDVYSQFTRIKDPTARRDAARLGKEDRQRLPRVTAYCTAGSYRNEELMRFLKGRMKTKGAAPKLFDECLYTPYSYKKDGRDMNERGAGRQRRGSGAVDDREEEDKVAVHSQPQRRFSDSALEVDENATQRREDLIDLHNAAAQNGDTLPASSSTVDISAVAEDASTNASLVDRPFTPEMDTTVHIPEVFLFEYGVVVIWGMTVKEEQRFLKEISKFEQEKLSKDDVQTEEFNFYYTREYQARIYNDFISLREKRNYMTKLAISHALAQSTKVSRVTLPPYTHGSSLMRVYRPHSTKTSSTPPSKRRKTSPPKLPQRAASTSHAAKSTCKSANSSSSASTFTYKAPCSTLLNSCGLSRNWSPFT